MGLRAGLDRCGKISSPLGFDPRTVQPVASRYTDHALPALFRFWYRILVKPTCALQTNHRHKDHTVNTATGQLNPVTQYEFASVGMN